MKEYKYEKVEDMTAGQVVDAMDGENFYGLETSENLLILTPSIQLRLLSNYIEEGRLYRMIEAPWWEKYVGSVVMARDSETDMWVSIMFHRYKKNSDYPFISNVESGWKYMRPLTAAEKDAIITEG